MSTNSDVLTARTHTTVLKPETTAEIALLPVQLPLDHSEQDERASRLHLFGKMADLLHRSLSRSRENSVGLSVSVEGAGAGKTDVSRSNSVCNGANGRSPRLYPILARQSRVSLVKETNHVSLEYDPITRRKVLNTYEILREIGRGEHGRVKLARDLVHDELVAIKIVSRKSKKERQLLRMRRPLNMPPNQPFNNYENKIRREIAIMKRCDHKNIVRLKEVLDDMNLYKIYLVLEYMDRGEIKWKRRTPIEVLKLLSEPEDIKLPCCLNQKSITADEDNELLSEEFLPNLTFRQSRRILRDVLLGLEYLHMQGIVHRDIKPANLLVSLDYVVKISDFGVSFASSLTSSDEGIQFNDMELAKTVGTPAFFAPELCQTNFSASASTVNVALAEMSNSASKSTEFPRVDHKIDIWALGVTLYCLLFGKVPFNAESEFKLFDVIVNEELQFPENEDLFHSPQEVTPEEFECAKDLLLKMLHKNSRNRIDIPEIKQHPFVLMDLENDVNKLNELFFFNTDYMAESDALTDLGDKVTQEEIDNAVIGVGARIRSSILRAMKTADNDTLRKLLVKMENSISNVSLSDDSSHLNSQQNLSAHLYNSANEHSVILSEALQESSLKTTPDYFSKNAPVPPHLSHFSHISSGLAQPPHLAPNQSPLHSSQPSFASRGSMRTNFILLDVVDSPVTSRKGSITAISEAPQIETKRNVGGDLYLKNQSAIDAFKDIQEMDQKRRRLSVFTSLSQSHNSSHNSSVSTNARTEDESAKAKPVTSVYIDKASDAPSKIKVGPISIDKNRRPLLVISLPLTESFASLDSLNDEYLLHKYNEFRKQRASNSNTIHLESALVDSVNPITEKFEKFNLGTLMAGTTQVSTRTGSDNVAPTRKVSASLSLSFSSHSSSCSSGSSSDEEEGNLTLKFTPKVAPKSRPPFLTLNNRAHSHELNLLNLAHQQPDYYDVPIVFQDHLLELEDVPVGLMGGRQNGENFDATPMSASTTLPGISLNATITPDSLLAPSKKVPIQKSPLRKEITNDSPVNSVERNPASRHDSIRWPNSATNSRATGYFNNHYKKESIKSPFPFAKHLDTDKESESKRELKQHRRPVAVRSNSIAVGLLLREHSLNEEVEQ